MKNLIRKIAIWTLVLSMTIATYGCSKKKNNTDIQTSSQTSSIEQSTSLDSESSEEHTSDNESQSTTGDESASSSVKEEETTKQEQQTTTKQETTTKKPETTTKKPEATSKKPEVTTTKQQETSNKEEETTTEVMNTTKYNEYKLVQQSYDFVCASAEGNLVVKKGNKYGIVSYTGKVIVPLQYDEFSIVGENELEFLLNDTAYVYSSEGKLLLSYKPQEIITNKALYAKTYVIGSIQYGLLLYNEFDRRYGEYEDLDKNSYIYRTYYNGVMIEKVIYMLEDGHHRNIDYITLKKAITGEVILSTFGVMYSSIGDNNANGLYISNLYSDDIILFTHNASEEPEVGDFTLKTDATCLYIINKEGYIKKVFKSNDITFNSDCFYNDGWFKCVEYLCDFMINVNTLDVVYFPSTVINEGMESFYYGRGQLCGVKTYGTDLFYLIKGNTILSSGYEWLNFSHERYIIAGKNGKYIYLDYNGKKVAEFVMTSHIIDGKALIYDGTGLYYVDESFNKISDYVYTGKFDSFGSSYIIIDGKCYLISN